MLTPAGFKCPSRRRIIFDHQLIITSQLGHIGTRFRKNNFASFGREILRGKYMLHKRKKQIKSQLVSENKDKERFYIKLVSIFSKQLYIQNTCNII